MRLTRRNLTRSVVALVALVARSKLVLDFALTLHVLHLVIVTLYTGFVPRHAMWWATMAGSSAVAVAGGTYGCRWRELRPINFGGNNNNNNNNNNAGPSSADPSTLENGLADDEELGFSRGRGRGRGRDGGGEYEMVGLKGDGSRLRND